MATETNTIVAILKLRRDTEANYSKVKNTFVPSNGEVCLVDTAFYGLRCKIGNGQQKYSELPFMDNTNNIILSGYKMNGNFFTDSSYSTELDKGLNHLYRDLNSPTKEMYMWNGTAFSQISPILATDETPGVMKLYQSNGQNNDGTMTQKAITNGVTSIKFSIDQEDDECLRLSYPW